MSVRPLEDRILIKPIEPETKTASGIFLPESAKEKPMQGKVVATGPGKLMENGERQKMLVKKGDTVLFGKYAGTDVSVGGQEYKILKENEILARIEPA